MLTLEGDGEYEQQVVGESHYQAWIERVVGGRTEKSAECYTEATLVIEHDNPHDQFAVKVAVLGGPVGFLPRDDAKAYRRWLARTHGRLQDAKCPALIRGGWVRDGERGFFGVVLDLPAFG